MNLKQTREQEANTKQSIALEREREKKLLSVKYKNL